MLKRRGLDPSFMNSVLQQSGTKLCQSRDILFIYNKFHKRDASMAKWYGVALVRQRSGDVIILACVRTSLEA